MELLRVLGLMLVITQFCCAIGGHRRSHRSHRRKISRLDILDRRNWTCKQQGEYYQLFKLPKFAGQTPMDNLLTRMKGRWPCRDSKVTGVIDVGANTGQDNLYFASAFGEEKCWGGRVNVHLFEPNSILIPDLRKSAEEAEKVGGVKFEVINAAASNISGISYFNVDPDKTQHEHSVLSKEKTATTVSVKSLRIDQWVRERGITRIPLFKIDAEGFDPQVLEGAKGIFPIVEVLLWECHELMDPHGFRLRPTVKFLEGHGFVTYVIGSTRSLLLNDPYWQPELENKTWQNCASFPWDSPLHTREIIPGPCTRRWRKSDVQLLFQDHP